MSESGRLANVFFKPANFFFREVIDPNLPAAAAVVPLPANLGPLAAFTGTFTGQGFNTIFRPDVTSGSATGIHFEPGLWLAVPATTNPNEPFTVARMASIPHGTTLID